MDPSNSSLQSGDEVSPYDTTLESSGSNLIMGEGKDGKTHRASLFRYNRTATLVTVLSVLVILAIGLASFALSSFLSHRNTPSGSQNNAQPSVNYAVGSLPVQAIQPNGQLQVGQADQLAINGQLKVNNTLVLSPTSTPSSPVPGQIYYDKTSKQPYYYDGSQFVGLNPNGLQHIASIGGAAGALSLGTGLQVSGNQLSISTSLLQSVSGAGTGGSGVASLQGLTGAVTLHAGSGIAISGTTITNSGITGLFGTANEVNASTNGGGVTISLPQAIDAAANVQFNSLILSGGDLSLAAAAAVRADNITTVGAGTTLTINADGNLSFKNASGTNSFTFPTSGGLGQVICTTAITCASGGGQAILLEPTGVQTANANKTAVFINKSGGTGNLIELQDAGADALVIDNAGNTTITKLTVSNGLTVNGGTVTFSGLNSVGVVHTSASGQLSTSPVALSVDTSGNYLASLGTLTGLTLGGTNGSPGAVPALSVSYGSLASTAVQGNTTLTCSSGTGNLTGGGDVITLGSGGTCTGLTITSSPTFSGSLTVQGAGGVFIGNPGTITGSLVLANGANARTVTLQVAAQTVGSSTVTIPNAAGVNDTVCLLTLANCAGTGGGVTTASGTQNFITKYNNAAANQLTNSQIFDNGSGVAIGSTSPVGLFNVGASSQFQVGSNGAITAPNSSNTINNLVINNGTLSNVTGYVQTSGNFDQSTSIGSFATGTGAVKLNGDTTVAGTHTLSVNGGLTSLGGGLSVTAGLTTLSGGATVSGATNVNTAGSSSTNINTGTNTGGVAIGNSSGTFSLVSSGLNVTAGGALSGITTIATSGAINTATISGGNLSSTAVDGLGVSGTSITGSAALSIASTGVNAVTLDTGGASTVNVGNTNAATIQIGRLTGTVPTVNIQGNSVSLASSNGTNSTTLGFSGTQAPGNIIYNFDRTVAPGTYTICTTIGNCAGAGGGITGSGTSGNIVKFSGTGTVTNSSLSESGATVTASGNLVVQGSGSLSLGTSSVNDGSIAFNDANGTHTVTLKAPASDPAANLTFTLPNAYGSSGYCLQSNGLGGLSFQPCTGGGAGGVTSLDGQTGVLSLANSTGSSGTITINNAKADGTTKGIATFNNTNFSDNGSGGINTIQDIATSASPTFAQLTSTGGIIASGNINTTAGALQLNGVSINTAGALTNVAYLNQANTFTVAGNQFTASGTALSVTHNASVGGTLTVGVAGSGTGSFMLANSANANTVTLQAAAQTAGSSVISIPNVAGVNDTVCLLTLANCVGTGGGVSSTGGTAGIIPVFNGSSAIGNSLLSQGGGTVTANGNFNLATGNQYQINGTQIASSNLSNDANLAKLNASQTFTGSSNTFKNASNSTSAFQVQDAGGNNVLTIDTVNGVVGVGATTATAKLTVVGKDQTSGNDALVVSNSGSQAVGEFRNDGLVGLGIGGSSTFGNTTPGPPDTSDNYTNLLVGSKFSTGAVAPTISSMSVYVNGPIQSSPHDQFQVGIYTDSSGAPNAWVASSTATTLTGNAWNTVPVSASLSANTTYWLVYTTNVSTGGDNTLDVANTGTPTYFFAGWNFGTGPNGGMPSSISGAATSNHLISIYATTSNTNAPALVVGTNGAVGIGTGSSTAPTANLQVKTLTNTTSAFVVQNAAGASELTVDTTNNQVMLGTAGNLTGQLTFTNSANSNTVSITSASQANNVALTIPADTNTTDTLCLQALGNCSGTGVLSGSGTAGTIAVFTGSSVLGNSLLSQSGSTMTTAGAAIFKNTANSTTAFQVQDAGTNAILDVNTTNGNVGVGTNNPTAARLSVVGATSDNTTTALSVVNSAGNTIGKFINDGSVNLGQAVTNFLGNTSSGNFLGSGYGSSGTTNNLLNAESFTTTSGGTLSSISTYIGGSVLASPNNKYQMAVYTDSSGAPSSLVASTSVGTLTPNAWNTLPISGATLSASTTYWFMYWTNDNVVSDNNNAQNFITPYGGSNHLYQGRNAWTGTTPPSTFPSGSTIGNYETSIYATYAATAPALTLNTSGALTQTGAATFTDAVNSTTAFQVQNASGMTQLLVDTANSQVAVNGTGLNGSNFTVNGTTTLGNVSSSTALQVNSTVGRVLTVDTAASQVVLGQALVGTINLGFATVGGGTLTVSPTSTASNFTLTLPAETGTICTNAATSICSTAGTGFVRLAPASVQADSSIVSSIFINKTSASGNLLELQNAGSDVLIVGNTGALTLKSTGYINTNSTVALNVEQNGVNNNVLTVDTTHGWVGIDKTPGLAFDVSGTAAASNGFLINTASATNGFLAKQSIAGTGGVSQHDVVVLNSSVQVVDTTTARDTRVYGVAESSAVSGNGTNITIAGNTTVNADAGTINIGDQLVTSSTSGAVTVDNNATTGILGYATTSKGAGVGTVGIEVRPVNGVTNPNIPGNLTVQGTGASSFAGTLGITGLLTTSGGITDAGAVSVSTSSTGASLTVTSSANPTNSLLVVNNSNVSATGNLLDLQNTGISKFTVNAAGNLSVQGGINNNGQSITSAGAISGATTIAANNKLTLSGTGANELAVTGAPAATANISLVQFGSAIANGNIAANGGTYLGINEPVSGNAGAAADFLNFQNNGTVELQVTSGGAVTANGALTVNGGGATITGAVTLGGGLTPDITTAGTSTAAALTIQPGTSNGASSNGPGLTLQGGNSSGTTSVTGGKLSLQGGNATGGSGTRNGGAVAIDAGTGATGNGQILIGSTNDAAITLGKTNGTSTITVGQSTANNTINIGNAVIASGKTQTVNIGANASSLGVSAINIGSQIGTSSVNIEGGTNNVNIDGSQQVNIGTSSATQIQFGGANGQTVNIGATGLTSNSTTVNIATGGIGITQSVTVGATGGTSSTTLNAGRSGIALQTGNMSGTAASGGITLSTGNQTGTSLQSGSISLTTGDASGGTNSSSGSITIDSGAKSGSGTTGGINIGTTNSSAVTVGNNTVGTVTTMQGGATQLQLQNSGAAFYTNTASNGVVIQNSNSTVGNNALLAQNTGTQGIAGVFNNTNISNTSDTLATVATLGQSSSTHIFAAVSGSGGVYTDMFTIGATGMVNARNLSNSTAAFQVQNAAGKNILAVDTSGNNIALGTGGSITGNLQFANSTNTNLITLNAGTTSAAYSLALPTTGATGLQCLQSTSGSTSTVTALQFGSCSGTGGSLQAAYNASAGATPSIDLTSTNKAFTIQNDNTSGISGELFGVHAATGSGLGSGILTVNSTGTVNIGSIGTATGQLYISGSVPSAAAGFASTSNQTEGVYVQGRYAYVVSNFGGSIQVVDVSNPASPSVVSTSTGYSGLTSIYVQGKYAYVVGGTQLFIVDISNPHLLAQTASLFIGLNWNAQDVYVQGRYAYIIGSVSGAGTEQLSVADISNPVNPVFTGGGGNLAGSTGGPFKVYVQGHYLYVTTGGSPGLLQIFDISNPSTLVSVSSFTVASSGTTTGLYVQGRYAYVTDETNGKLYIIDVSNPASPSIANTGGISTGTTPVDVYVQGRYAYVVNQGAGTMQTFDVSNPASPSLINGVNTSATPNALYVQGRYAYVVSGASGSSGFQSFDLGGAYIQQLQVGGIETGTLQTNGNANVNGDLAVQGGLTTEASLIVGGSLYSNGTTTVGSDTESFTDTAASTHNVATPATAYSITDNDTHAAGGASFTTTINITGVPEDNGTFVFVSLTSAKNTTTAAEAHTTILQINSSTTLSTVATTSVTGAQTVTHSFTLAKINSVWTVVGSGLASVVSSTSSTATTADYAEWVDYSGSVKPQAGEVLTVGDNADSVKDSATPYGGALGVVSTTPYQVGGADDGHSVIIALAGRVPVKVNLENGPIAVGDYLTSSSTSGVAMKATKPGNIIGTALEAYDGTQSDAQVMVQLHPGYADPTNGQTTNQIQGNVAISGNLSITGNTTIGGDLTVSGTTTTQNLVVSGSTMLAALTVSGAVAAQSLTVSGAATVGSLSVTGNTTIGGDLTVGGHFITGGGSPTASANTTLAGSSATCTVNGNDTSGSITLAVLGTGQGAGLQCTVNFSKAFATAPRPVLTPTDGSSVSAGAYVNATTKTMTLNFANTPGAGQTYNFNYFSPQ